RSAGGIAVDPLTATRSFTTLGPPSVATGAAVSISGNGATLQAEGNPEGVPTASRFQYSTDPSFPLTTITRIRSGSSGPGGVALDGAGNVFVSDNGNDVVNEYLTDGTVKTIGSGFKNPYGVAVDAAGNVYVGDYGNNAVKKVSPDGTIQTIGSGFNAPYGV